MDMSTTERAQGIRNAIKALGYKARAVSVRCDQYSMGSTIYVTVRDASVDFAKVNAAAHSFERIDRCESTGEILSGGNTFVEVKIARDVLDALAAPIAALISDEPGSLVEIDGWRVRRCTLDDRFYRATGNGANGAEIYCWGKDFCARQLVERGVRVSAVQAA